METKESETTNMDKKRFIFCHRTKKEINRAETPIKSIAKRYKPLHKLYLLYTCFSP